MSEDKKPSLTPISENLKAACQVWSKNLKKFILVYLWGLMFALISLAIVVIFLGLSYWQGANISPTFKILTVVVTVLGFLSGFYFSCRAGIGLILLVKKNYEGKVWDIFVETEKYFWPYLGLTLLTTIFILLWCLLLIIPGIIYGIFYSFAVYTFFFEGKKGMAAIRRSTQLVEGYWWPVFGRFIFIGFLVWLVQIILAIPIRFMDFNSIYFHIWYFIMQIFSLIVGPIVLLYVYNIYQDLVKIKK